MNIAVLKPSRQAATMAAVSLLALSLACGISGAQAPPIDRELKQRFVTEAPVKWADYAVRAKMLQGSWQCDTLLTSGGKTTRVWQSMTWKTNGQDFSYQFEQERSHNGTVVFRQDKTIDGGNSKYVFTLNRKGPSSDWRIADLKQGEEEIAKVRNDSPIEMRSLVLVEIRERLLSDIVKRKEFVITGCKAVQWAAEDLVEVTFDFDNKGIEQTFPFQGGSLVLDPKRYWCVRSWQAHWRDAKSPEQVNSIKFKVVELSEAKNSLPWAKKVVVDWNLRDNVTRSDDISFDLHIPDVLPAAEEFRLSHYGLPEPGGVTWPKPRPWYLYFMGGGVVCLALGIFLRRRLQGASEAESRTMADRLTRKGSPLTTHHSPLTMRRSGFSLLEILVVLAIISVLFALLVPAVQKVRAAAAQAHCANNLKQIGLAAHQFHDANKTFPSGVQIDGPYPFSSWLTHLLPYLEQQALWDATVNAYALTSDPSQNPPHVGLATSVPVFACPADDRVNNVQFSAANGFNVALTSYLGVLGINLDDPSGVLYADSSVRMTDIRDGTSNTLLAGERPPSPNFQFGWWYAGSGQASSGSLDMILGIQEINVLPGTVSSCPPGPYNYGPGGLTNPCDMFHFWSLHSGGANFVLADSSVRFITYGISTTTMAAVSTISGNDFPGSDW